MSYDILKNLGLDHVDPNSPDFLKTLERMQREAWQSLQGDDQDASDSRAEWYVGIE
jgi:acyl-CoA-binding protein